VFSKRARHEAIRRLAQSLLPTCQGTPLRNEIEARCADKLEIATDYADPESRSICDYDRFCSISSATLASSPKSARSR